MAKRTQRARVRPGRKTEPERPAWPVQGHSGEGSASALAVLQKLEKGRDARRPAEPPPEDDDPLR